MQLAGDRVDGMLVTSPENIRYLCGFCGTEGTLVLTDASRCFFTDGRYTTQARDQAACCRVITYKDKFREIGRHLHRGGIRRVGIESRHISVALLNQFMKEAAGVEPVPLGSELDGLRIVKDAAETALLRKAARKASESLAETLACVRPGVSELDVAAELEFRMRRKGGDCPAFPTIVASGPRSALPHAAATDKKLSKGEFVTIDFGVQCAGYCSDQTRTFILGRPTKKQRRIYDAVLKAHDRAIAAVRAGRPLKAVDAAARKVIERTGYAKRFIHGTGHGLGLCVHEPPVVSPHSTGSAEKGMVFTIEPGIYLPRWGGVRIEDTIVVTAQGCERITEGDCRLICLDA